MEAHIVLKRINLFIKGNVLNIIILILFIWSNNEEIIENYEHGSGVDSYWFSRCDYWDVSADMFKLKVKNSRYTRFLDLFCIVDIK